MVNTNTEVSSFFAEQPAERLAFIWIVTYQVKKGRRWEAADEGFLTLESAQARKLWLEKLYGSDLRNFHISVTTINN